MNEDILRPGALDMPNPPGREKEMKEIKQMIKEQRHIILLGARRVGKTSLKNAIVKTNLEHTIIEDDCMNHRNINMLFAHLFAYSKHIKIFVSSVGKKGKEELGKEREIAEKTIKKCGCEPFLIENIADPDPPSDVEEKNIADSDAFLLILGKEDSENVMEEYKFALEYKIPIFCMIKGEKDDGRDTKVIGIIKEIQQNNTAVYKRYSNGKEEEFIKEFREILNDSIERKEKEWRRERIERCMKDEWRITADKFFESVKGQKNKFLFLIDEFGELRNDANVNFDDLLAYLRAKTDEPQENVLFIITGSENVFTFENQKYLINFDNFWVRPFENGIAVEVLRIMLKDKHLDDKLLNKFIEICGTLPADIKLFALKIRRKKKINEDDLIDITNELMKNRELIMVRDIFFNSLDSESKKFLEKIMPDLPASKNQMKLLYEPENFDEILDKISEYHFILEEKGGVYYPISSLLRWAIIYKNDINRFNDLITKI